MLASCMTGEEQNLRDLRNIKPIYDNDCNSILKYKLIKLLKDTANKLEIRRKLYGDEMAEDQILTSSRKVYGYNTRENE